MRSDDINDVVIINDGKSQETFQYWESLKWMKMNRMSRTKMRELRSGKWNLLDNSTCFSHGRSLNHNVEKIFPNFSDEFSAHSRESERIESSQKYEIFFIKQELRFEILSVFRLISYRQHQKWTSLDYFCFLSLSFLLFIEKKNQTTKHCKSIKKWVKSKVCILLKINNSSQTTVVKKKYEEKL